MEIFNEYHLFGNRPRRHTVRRADSSTLELSVSYQFQAFQRFVEKKIISLLETLIDFATPYVFVRSALPFASVHVTPGDLRLSASYVYSASVEVQSSSIYPSESASPRVSVSSLISFLDSLYLTVLYNRDSYSTSLTSPSYYSTVGDILRV